MGKPVVIVGAGLAGTEAALQLARRGIDVVLHEMRPVVETPVHKTSDCAELVCSNSLKSTKPESAAGMLKRELERLGSVLLAQAAEHRVAAGGALAVDRAAFGRAVTGLVEREPRIELRRGEVPTIGEAARDASVVLLATGPLTSDALAGSLSELVGNSLSFFDAAAPIVMADSLDRSVLFRQSRYEDARGDDGEPRGDYLNAPFDKGEYERFIEELVAADRVMAREFETAELFQACQPIEEIARKGLDAPRFGPLKPVGLTDPRTGRRPWAALQLRTEDAAGTSYNLVGFQTNLTFPEQARVFRMIPGMGAAEFARYGVMHRNTFIDAPRLLDGLLRLHPVNAPGSDVPICVAGQLAGTEGYCEAIRSGLHAAISIAALLAGNDAPPLPEDTAFGALLAYATNPETVDYQPMHVNFGIMPPLSEPIRNKRQRNAAYAERGARSLERYRRQLAAAGLMEA